MAKPKSLCFMPRTFFCILEIDMAVGWKMITAILNSLKSVLKQKATKLYYPYIKADYVNLWYNIW